MSTRNLGPLVPGAPSLAQLGALANEGVLIGDTAIQFTSASTTYVVPTGMSATVTKHLSGSTSTPIAANTGSGFAVEGDMELFVTGATGTVAEFGVRFTEVGGAGTVVEAVLGRKYFNETLLTDTLTGFNKVATSPFPAGTYTMVPIFRRLSGTGTVAFGPFYGCSLVWKEYLR